MSKVDDLMKLLDNGVAVSIFKNDLGSYTAIAHNMEQSIIWEELLEDQFDESQITDDFTPEKALYRLVEKVTTGRIV